ncbi:ABC transporter permease [Aminobacter ciceronei]|uniref:Peptide/nickel transport system permease protein n=1 Tax=Aminobacter ciceronei TaxID=150723 RepID=A0ABR6CF95_9HYPH|nr:ABC transporter permease [Aminobacter ciceronei]MBA8909946.1 peptide/nickel transport system permease protein [Aminobacter ciceronei]MBA9023718.1 peptide/nickel transport system permease protein [Aminobacter ciceronei]
MVVKKFSRDLPATFGLIVVMSILTVAVFGWWLVSGPSDVYDSNLLARLSPPSAQNPFGTDDLGRDVYSRVIIGARSALLVGVGVVAASMLIGVPIGLYAGYTRTIGSEVVMRITDIFLAVPQLVLALAIAQILSRGLESAMLALALTYWPAFARTVYGEVRHQKTSLYVEALEGLGASPFRIAVLHLLPNVAPAIIIRATIGVGFAILTAATLGFLGIGATPPSPDWGLAIAESRQFLPESWWLALFPGLAIFITVLGFNLLGDGLRDILDPKLRRSR